MKGRTLVQLMVATLSWLSGFPVQSQASEIQFVDVTRELGVDFRHVSSATPQKYLPETMGSGVALFDYDGDGRLDIFFANGAEIQSPMPENSEPVKTGPRFYNRLYRQQPDGSFRDVTESAGVQGRYYDTGVAVGDYDNDGDPDLFVGNVNGNTLYQNNGDGTFDDVTEQAGVRGSGWSSSVAFVDYDHDGWLDIVVGRYLEWSFDDNISCGGAVRAYCDPGNFPGIAPLLFRNQGDGSFLDATESSGMAEYPGKALGVGIADINRDGLIDIFIGNDGMEQFLLENRGGGRLEEVALFSGVAMDQDGNTFAGMGVDVADFDNDALPDILITNLSNQNYALYRNEGGDVFSYASDWTGLSKITLLYAGWGFRFVDVDNDGWRDLFITQGHVLDTIEVTSPHLSYAQPPFLLKNRQGKAFLNISEESGEIFRRSFVGRGLAIGDIDNDGDLDVVVSTLDGPAHIFRNEGNSGNHWLVIEVEGTRSNRDGIGAEVEVELTDGSRLFATVTATSSYQSSSDPRVHFGLGKEEEAREIEIRWPSGRVQKLGPQKADQVLKVKEIVDPQ